MTAGPVLAASGVRVAFAVLELAIFASWALLFAVMIGMLMYLTVLRGRRERRRLRTPPAVSHADPHLPARLAEMRRADPHFDDQLLRDAARMACLIIFAAMATGDEQAIRRLAIPSFWSTVFGRWVKTSAHDARVRRARGGPDGQAAMAAATSLSSLAGSFGQAMGQRMDGAPAGLDWLSWDGQYDLAFTRPAGSRTNPGAALASRTCAACGRAYRSELATVCEYCKAERPTLWGQWRLANVTVVDE